MKLLLKITLILVLLTLVPVLGSSHVPVSEGDNSTLESAALISNPIKSWAIYSQLDGDQDVSYFKFEIKSGERIYVSLFVPYIEEQQNFLPQVAIMGPGLTSAGTPPSFIETTGTTVVVERARSEPKYEPFGPSHTIEIASFDQPAPETGFYFLAVYSEQGEGNFGIAIGYRESFTLLETITNPINVIEVYRWEGQNWATILLPYLATLALGFYLFRRSFQQKPTTLQWFLTGTGLLFLSSSVSFTYQMFYNIAITGLGEGVVLSLVIILFQAGIASVVLYEVPKQMIETNKTAQLRVILVSILALFTWVGLILGPILGFLLGFSLLFRGSAIDIKDGSSTT